MTLAPDSRPGLNPSNWRPGQFFVIRTLVESKGVQRQHLVRILICVSYRGIKRCPDYFLFGRLRMSLSDCLYQFLGVTSLVIWLKSCSFMTFLLHVEGSPTYEFFCFRFLILR
jgi:hypothetical protein